MLCDTAREAGVDPITLLALSRAESVVDATAERYGGYTHKAQQALALRDMEGFAKVIVLAGADVSFSEFQLTLGFGFWKDQTPSVENILAFRQYLQSHREEIMLYVGKWLVETLPTVDNDPLRAFVKFNSGGDNLNKSWYIQNYGDNIQRYRDALAWAEDYRI